MHGNGVGFLFLFIGAGFACLLGLGFLVSWFGSMIYGGIWWGRLRDGPEHASGRPRQFWQTTLAMWVCSLVLPVPAPWICSCILTAWTTKSGCEQFDKELNAVPVSDPHYQLIQDWYLQCTIKGGEKGCIDYICSGISHKLMLSFAVLGGLGIAGVTAAIIGHCAAK